MHDYVVEGISGVLLMGADHPVMMQVSLVIIPKHKNTRFSISVPADFKYEQLYPIEGIETVSEPIPTKTGDYILDLAISGPSQSNNRTKIEFGIVYGDNPEQSPTNLFSFPCTPDNKRVDLEVLFPVEHQPVAAYGGVWVNETHHQQVPPDQQLVPKLSDDAAFVSVRLTAKNLQANSLVGIEWC